MAYCDYWRWGGQRVSADDESGPKRCDGVVVVHKNRILKCSKLECPTAASIMNHAHFISCDELVPRCVTCEEDK